MSFWLTEEKTQPACHLKNAYRRFPVVMSGCYNCSVNFNELFYNHPHIGGGKTFFEEYEVIYRGYTVVLCLRGIGSGGG